jgi:hypothetical protein
MANKKLTVKRLSYGKYEVVRNGVTYRIFKEQGMWDVKMREIKHCEHWFTVDSVPLKKNALRLIEDGHYEKAASGKTKPTVVFEVDPVNHFLKVIANNTEVFNASEYDFSRFDAVEILNALGIESHYIDVNPGKALV